MINGYRLSPQQNYLWATTLDNSTAPYCAQCLIRIEGGIEYQTLKAALYNVVSRHEILRTAFKCLSGMTIPVQVIFELNIIPIEEYDFEEIAAQAQIVAVDNLLDQISRRPYSNEQYPQIRVVLIRLSIREILLFIDLPALCADAVSLKCLVSEISRSYESCLKGEEFFSETMQYADLAEWQNELLESDETDGSYWDVAGATELRMQKLPFERVVRTEPDFDPQFIAFTIDSDLATQVHSLIQKYRIAIPELLLACWQILLYRLMDQPIITVGLACDGRRYDGLQQAIGLFVKYLPIECHFEAASKLSQIIESINSAAHEARDWQEYFTWERMGEQSHDDKSIGFFPFCFEFEERTADYRAQGATFSIDRLYTCVSRFKVKLTCIEEQGKLTAELHYDASLYDLADLERLSQQLLTLLEEITTGLDQSITSLRIVGGKDLERILFEFNDTQAFYCDNKTVQKLFEEQSESAPDSLAVVFGEQYLSYGGLNRRANQLAHHLRKLGVAPEERVAVCLWRSLELVVGVLGVLKAGGAYVPLDPTYPIDRLSYLLRDSRSLVLLTHSSLIETLRDHAARVVTIDRDWDIISKQSERNPEHVATSDNIIYVIYTSGSTGLPKGVMVAHRSVINYLTWINNSLLDQMSDDIPMLTSLTFDASLKQLLGPLICGGKVWCIPQEMSAQPGDLLDLIASHRYVTLNCVPSLWKAVLDAKQFSRIFIPKDSLTQLLVGGEQINRELIERSLAEFPDLKIWNLYGPTEATANASAGRIDSAERVCFPSNGSGR